MLFSASTKWFYDEDIHGYRKLTIVDPEWVRPKIDAPDPNYVVTGEEGEVIPMIKVDDNSIDAPTIQIDNPNCKIPSDAKEITFDRYQELLQGNSEGKVIDVDKKGDPILADPPAPTDEQENAIIKAQLAEIDNKKIRAMSDFILNGDKTVLQNLETQAAALRGQLK